MTDRLTPERESGLRERLAHATPMELHYDTDLLDDLRLALAEIDALRAQIASAGYVHDELREINDKLDSILYRIIPGYTD